MASLRSTVNWVRTSRRCRSASVRPVSPPPKRAIIRRSTTTTSLAINQVTVAMVRIRMLWSTHPRQPSWGSDVRCSATDAAMTIRPDTHRPAGEHRDIGQPLAAPACAL